MVQITSLSYTQLEFKVSLNRATTTLIFLNGFGEKVQRRFFILKKSLVRVEVVWMFRAE
jgi:hypothetical protein